MLLYFSNQTLKYELKVIQFTEFNTYCENDKDLIEYAILLEQRNY